jgi:hypothetical protein
VKEATHVDVNAVRAHMGSKGPIVLRPAVAVSARASMVVLVVPAWPTVVLRSSAMARICLIIAADRDVRNSGHIEVQESAVRLIVMLLLLLRPMRRLGQLFQIVSEALS